MVSPTNIRSHGLRGSIHLTWNNIQDDTQGGGSLYMNCRHRLKHRFHHIGGKRIPIPDRTNIRERSEEADGKRFGDWKMDTIVGKNDHGAILTLIEQSSNFLLMRKFPKGKNAKETALTVVWLLEPFKPYVKTITADNGTEFAHHKYTTCALTQRGREKWKWISLAIPS